MFVSQDKKIISLEAGEPVPDSWREQFLQRAGKLHVKSGKILIEQNDLTNDVYYIVKGSVQFSRAAENGKISILRNLNAGFMFGELAALDSFPRSVRVETLEDCIFAKQSAKVFLQFLNESPAANKWLLNQMSGRIRDLTERNFQLATMSIASRFMYELLRLCIENGIDDNRSVIESFPTHETIALRIGTHREAVSKELGLLTQEGLIEKFGRMASRKIAVTDVRKLRENLSRSLQ